MSDQNMQKTLDIIRQAIPETVQSLRDIVNDANADATTRAKPSHTPNGWKPLSGKLVDLQPRTIGIVCIMPDGTTGTQYFNADNRDRLVMCEALQIDSLDELIRVNADHFRDVILGEEDEDKE